MDDVQNLILRIQGQDELAVLNKQLDNETRILTQLAADLRQGNISQAQFDQGAKAMAASIVGLNQQISQLNVGAKGLANPQSLLGLSYIFDDLANTSGGWERKLASISNNIPGLIMSLGKEGLQGKIAALAGPIGLVSTALIALAPLAKAAWEAIADGKPKEALDDLADRAKTLKAELEKLRGSVTSDEADTRKHYEELLAGHTPDVERGIAAGLASSGTGAQMTAEETQRIERGRQDMNLARSESAKAAAAEQMRNVQIQIQQRINTANAETAGQLAAQIPTNANVRKRVRGFADAKPGLFPSGFASDMAALEPERMASDAAEADAWQEQTDEWAAQGKRKRERLAKEKRDKAAENHKIDMLNHQGEQADAERARIADRERRQTEREGQQAQRELDRAATPAAQRQREIEGRAQQLSELSQRHGLGLGDDQIQQAAAQVVTMTRAGVQVNQAMMGALRDQIAHMQALQMQLQGQLGQIQMMAARNRSLGMGPDQSGRFSALPPALGY